MGQTVIQMTAGIRRALEGSRVMKITFKPEAVSTIATICGMDNAGIVDISREDAEKLTSVMREKTWDDLPDRTVTVKAVDKFDAAKFIHFAEHFIENIEAVAV